MKINKWDFFQICHNVILRTSCVNYEFNFGINKLLWKVYNLPYLGAKFTMYQSCINTKGYHPHLNHPQFETRNFNPGIINTNSTFAFGFIAIKGKP